MLGSRESPQRGPLWGLGPLGRVSFLVSKIWELAVGGQNRALAEARASFRCSDTNFRIRSQSAESGSCRCNLVIFVANSHSHAMHAGGLVNSVCMGPAFVKARCGDVSLLVKVRGCLLRVCASATDFLLV